MHYSQPQARASNNTRQQECVLCYPARCHRINLKQKYNLYLQHSEAIALVNALHIIYTGCTHAAAAARAGHAF